MMTINRDKPRKNQKEMLRKLLAARLSFSHEVNHRVKNNLQMVTSLLSMQAIRLTDPVAKLAVGQALARIAAISLTQRLLYEQDNDEELGQINMAQLIPDLSEQLKIIYNDRPNIELAHRSCDAFVSADQATALSLFLVEAVTNAFRHAYRDGEMGQIMLLFERDGRNASICVSDNGQGFEQSDHTANMGVDLIHAYAKHLGGTIDIVTGGAGTSLCLRFRLLASA